MTRAIMMTYTRGLATLGLGLLLVICQSQAQDPLGCTCTMWTNQGSCSVTCGTGSQTQTRTCSNAVGSTCSQPGTATQTVVCTNTVACGTWTSWSAFTACSATCGNGTATRTRTCTPAPGLCTGSSSQSFNCASPSCPSAGTWTQWSAASSCSVTCGSGIITRTRVCIGSGGCIGSATLTSSCVRQSCPSAGTWTQWSAASSCSVTCDSGIITRTRVCIGSGGCIGSATLTSSCIRQPCPGPVGTWTQWSAGRCSVTCGSGVITRTRVCLSGNGCPGSSTQIVSSCIRQSCTGPLRPPPVLPHPLPRRPRRRRPRRQRRQRRVRRVRRPRRKRRH